MSKKILFSFFLFSFLSAQNCLSDASINEQYFNEDIIGLYLSAIDFNSGESNFLFFDYSIDGFDDDDVDCITDDSLSFKGGFKIHFNISMYIDQYHSSPEAVADGYINIFNIPENLTSLSFRNTDLTFESTNIQGADFNLKDAQIYIESQQDDLSQLFIETGRVPNGRYYFNFTLSKCSEYDSSSGDLSNCENEETLSKSIDIFVPSYIDLISPGSSSLADTLLNHVSNTYPTFQWNSDYCSNCDFSIRLVEYKPLIHSSLQEAISDYSIIPAESGFYELDNNSVFQYPASGFDNLIEGNYYVWQIKRSYETTNGVYNDFSPIFIFKINSPSTYRAPLDQDEQSDFTLENIRMLIGQSNYNLLFNINGPLYGYDNIESTLNLNNQNISSNFILQLIQMSNDNQIEIIEVDVE